MLRWDIFCRVIDNFGDIGVCWRLCAALAMRGQKVRLWVDDTSALAWMAPDGCEDVEIRKWLPNLPMPLAMPPGDVVIEAFGCEIDHAWIAINSLAPHADSTAANARKGLKNLVWINLEYLSAESFVQRSHGLASPVMAGAALGLTKWFFYPGFTAGTGGLISASDADADVDADAAPNLPSPENSGRISLFCYEPPALQSLIEELAEHDASTSLMVMAGRGQKALNTVIQSINAQSPAWNVRRALSIHEQPYMSQPQYNALLRSCELNFVRGEDSLVRAIWAGRAFVWQIYPQADGAHAAKLEAFLEWLQAPPDLREFHRVWNGLRFGSLPALHIAAWTACTLAARARLLAQRDLVSQLLDFVEEKAAVAA